MNGCGDVGYLIASGPDLASALQSADSIESLIWIDTTTTAQDRPGAKAGA